MKEDIMIDSVDRTGALGTFRSPQDWASAQINLGSAWAQSSTGDSTSNLRRAIACFEAAMSVFTEQAYPRQWAMIQNNLANAWADLSTGDPAENLRNAFDYYD